MSSVREDRAHRSRAGTAVVAPLCCDSEQGLEQPALGWVSSEIWPRVGCDRRCVVETVRGCTGRAAGGQASQDRFSRDPLCEPIGV